VENLKDREPPSGLSRDRDALHQGRLPRAVLPDEERHPCSERQPLAAQAVDDRQVERIPGLGRLLV